MSDYPILMIHLRIVIKHQRQLNSRVRLFHRHHHISHESISYLPMNVLQAYVSYILSNLCVLRRLIRGRVCLTISILIFIIYIYHHTFNYHINHSDYIASTTTTIT